MANFKTAIAAENEIMKATDFTFGYDSSIANVATALRAVLSNSSGDYIVGGKVKPYGSGGLNVSIEPIYVYKSSTQLCVAETEVTEPVSFERADDNLNRIDIVQVRGVEEQYDSQSRKFNDPATGTKTTRTVPTKKRVKLEVSVKKGSNGSASAPAADSGYVKIAEVIIPSGTTNITEDLIKNVTARKHNVSNEEWTVNKRATFNPGYLADIFYQFLVAHNEDGSHKPASIKAANIDFGTETTQVKGSDIPAGQSMSLHGVNFTSSDSLTALLIALFDNTNELYKYVNKIFSRYTFIPDSPVACSTENITVATGGEMTVDGVSVTIGQLVFLKDQFNAKENGLWEVQSGAWNRYEGYTTKDTDAFVHKFVLVKDGTKNKGKIFYLDGDFATIGVDELHFEESNLSTFANSYTIAMHDVGGRLKATKPVEMDDVVRKVEFDELTSHGDCTEGRNLLEVLGATTVKEAMGILHKKCNGVEKADFSGLMIGDYLDLPYLEVDKTNYKNIEAYQNLRIVIAGFNQYKNVGDIENTKNHILWNFRNVVLMRAMNESATNIGGYPSSDLKRFLDGVFAKGLKSVLGDHLYTIRRSISVKGSTGWTSETVFCPTVVEVFGIDTLGEDKNTHNTDVQFPLFFNSSFYRVKRHNGSRAWWWLATPFNGNEYSFCHFSDNGSGSMTIAANKGGGISPVFCTC